MAKADEKLASLIHSRMISASKYVAGSASLVLGKITTGMGLKLDDVPYTLSSDEYMVCRTAILNSSQRVTKSAENHTHGLNIPTLAVGDRVLVARVGSEPVIIDVVLAG